MENNFIKSIGYSDTEILKGIMKLNDISQFDLDCTYSIGKFYHEIKEPKYKMDIIPMMDCIQADSRYMPFKNNSMNSIIYDPPFMFGNHGQQKNYSATKRYTMYKSYEELKDNYIKTINECYRVLKEKGILVFKCQDFTDTKTTLLHNEVYNWAIESKFYAKDLFILINEFKIINTTLKQKHARKFHSYFYIFSKQKIKKENNVLVSIEKVSDFTIKKNEKRKLF